ncbi:hypothetical protein GCM10022393_13720 [Aquimarina addita]|uniref:Uncharacterized protein n=1 Tax=Aquimarina addita TaxID=870485 RepID=A0ABP7XFH4_9FLAO
MKAMIKGVSRTRGLIVSKIRHISETTNNDSILTLTLQMLLLIFLMYMNDNGYLSIFMPVILIPGILFKVVREHPYYWTLIACMASTFYLVLDLVGYVPNHKHIFAFIIIAVTIAMFLKEKIHPLRFLNTQSRLIIGFCFLFATIGKFMASEFLDGSFFEFTNTTDPRFFGFSSLMGKVDLNLLIENEENLRLLLKTNDPKTSFLVNGVDNIRGFGMLISYWTIFIEGMIAISFCLPRNFLLSKYRNVFLVTFILTTYPIATVTGFAIILTVLGFIQSLEDHKLTMFSWFYLFVFIFLPLNYFPFARLLALF